MAVLNESTRFACWSEYMTAASLEKRSLSSLKAVYRAAVDAADDWVEANMASYNSALPFEFRNSATAKEKAELLTRILNKRFIRGT